MTPKASGERSLSYKFTHYLHIVFVIGKYAYIFWLGKGGQVFCWEILQGKNEEGSFQGVNISGEIL